MVDMFIDIDICRYLVVESLILCYIGLWVCVDVLIVLGVHFFV